MPDEELRSILQASQARQDENLDGLGRAVGDDRHDGQQNGRAERRRRDSARAVSRGEPGVENEYRDGRGGPRKPAYGPPGPVLAEEAKPALQIGVCLQAMAKNQRHCQPGQEMD